MRVLRGQPLLLGDATVVLPLPEGAFPIAACITKVAPMGVGVPVLYGCSDPGRASGSEAEPPAREFSATRVECWHA